MEMVPKDTNHFISFDTYALKPILSKNRMVTRIIEHESEVIVPRSPLNIVKKSCHFYGNSFKSATFSARSILKKKHKVPIVVAHDFGNPFVFLPTLSPTAEDNMWIAFHAINFFEAEKGGCRIHLVNNTSIKVDVTDTTMYRQYSLGSMLTKNFIKKQQRLKGPDYFSRNRPPR